LLVSSFDSNLLVYAHNEAASEHKAAKKFVETMLATTAEQVLIVHQTLFELFSVLTSVAIFPRPLTPLQAWRTCDFYLTHSSIQTASYEFPVLSIVEYLLAEKPQRGKRFFDLVFAATLKYHAVNRLYTRNAKHFQNYGFLEVINPI
jgi:predicted nucleic acid-binding protein